MHQILVNISRMILEFREMMKIALLKRSKLVKEPSLKLVTYCHLETKMCCFIAIKLTKFSLEMKYRYRSAGCSLKASKCVVIC